MGYSPLYKGSAVDGISNNVYGAAGIGFPICNLSRGGHAHCPVVTTLVSQFGHGFLTVRVLPCLVLAVRCVTEQRVLVSSRLILCVLVKYLTIRTSVKTIVPCISSKN